MAVVLGNNPQQSNEYFMLVQKVKLQTQLIEDLMKLNMGQEEEIKRLVSEYDKLYEQYQHSLKFNKVSNE
jgi:predicted ATPase